MKTLEALQRDIDTSTDLQGIVRTMKVLAAVSIRQYERAQESLQLYSRTVELGIQAVLQNQAAAAIAGSQDQQGVGAVIFGSDHGLCGRYNESIAKFAFQQLQSADNQQDSIRILVIGARVETALHEMGMEAEDCFTVPGTVESISRMVQQILLKIDSWKLDRVGTVKLFYHARRSRSSYPPREEQLLPINGENFQRKSSKPWPSRSLPQFTLSNEELLHALVRQRLFINLFRACAESLAGEHFNRLMSMQIAEKNIQQRLDALTSTYRQQRQNQITEELLDVVSGFEAMQEENGNDAAGDGIR